MFPPPPQWGVSSQLPVSLSSVTSCWAQTFIQSFEACRAVTPPERHHAENYRKVLRAAGVGGHWWAGFTFSVIVQWALPPPPHLELCTFNQTHLKLFSWSDHQTGFLLSVLWPSRETFWTTNKSISHKKYQTLNTRKASWLYTDDLYPSFLWTLTCCVHAHIQSTRIHSHMAWTPHPSSGSWCWISMNIHNAWGPLPWQHKSKVTPKLNPTHPYQSPRHNWLSRKPSCSEFSSWRRHIHQTPTPTQPPSPLPPPIKSPELPALMLGRDKSQQISA